jgi:hypothetical protein
MLPAHVPRPSGAAGAVGRDVKPFERPPQLIDLAPTILAALDAPAAVQPTGRVLHEVVGTAATTTVAETAAPAIPGMGGPEETTVSDTEADEMEEHLRGLSYLE